MGVPKPYTLGFRVQKALWFAFNIHLGGFEVHGKYTGAISVLIFQLQPSCGSRGPMLELELMF